MKVAKCDNLAYHDACHAYNHYYLGYYLATSTSEAIVVLLLVPNAAEHKLLPMKQET
jgi:hypothetical protein